MFVVRGWYLHSRIEYFLIAFRGMLVLACPWIPPWIVLCDRFWKQNLKYVLLFYMVLHRVALEVFWHYRFVEIHVYMCSLPGRWMVFVDHGVLFVWVLFSLFFNVIFLRIFVGRLLLRLLQNILLVIGVVFCKAFLLLKRWYLLLYLILILIILSGVFQLFVSWHFMAVFKDLCHRSIIPLDSDPESPGGRRLSLFFCYLWFLLMPRIMLTRIEIRDRWLLMLEFQIVLSR